MMTKIITSEATFFITALISLFVIIDPPGNLFPYLAFSAELPRPAARGLAWRSCFYAFLVLTLSAFVGRLVLRFFGIGLPAFQIAGGLILFRIAIDMLEGRGHFNRIDTASSLNAADYRDVALIPLAVPLLSGPGAISTILVLTSRSQTPLQDGLILLALAFVLLLAYLLFRFAHALLEVFKESRVRLMTRLMGLILAALAVEFVIEGLAAAFPSLR